MPVLSFAAVGCPTAPRRSCGTRPPTARCVRGFSRTEALSCVHYRNGCRRNGPAEVVFLFVSAYGGKYLQLQATHILFCSLKMSNLNCNKINKNPDLHL